MRLEVRASYEATDGIFEMSVPRKAVRRHGGVRQAGLCRTICSVDVIPPKPFPAVALLSA
jgi:hypothetical protein